MPRAAPRRAPPERTWHPGARRDRGATRRPAGEFRDGQPLRLPGVLEGIHKLGNDDDPGGAPGRPLVRQGSCRASGMGAARLTKATPSACSSSSSVIRCLRFRPSRLRRQQTPGVYCSEHRRDRWAADGGVAVIDFWIWVYLRWTPVDALSPLGLALLYGSAGGSASWAGDAAEGARVPQAPAGDHPTARGERAARRGDRLRTDPAAGEERARRDLGLIKPGEKVFIIRDVGPAGTSPRTGAARRQTPRNSAGRAGELCPLCLQVLEW